MGQSASNPSEQGLSSNENLRSSRRWPRRAIGQPSRSLHLPEGPSLRSTTGDVTARSAYSRPPSTRLFATFTRQISASSVRVVRGVPPQGGSSSQRDAIFYEQQEERPLVYMEDLGLRNAPITHITASPMPRQSRLSRLSSMIIPRDVNRTRSRGRREHQLQWQRRPLTRDSLEIARQVQRHRRPPHDGAGSLELQEEARQRGLRQFAPISRPITPPADSFVPSSFLAFSSQDIAPGRPLLLDSAETQQSSRSTVSQLSRLARIRQTISPPFDISSIVRRSPDQDFVANTSLLRTTRNSLPIVGFIPETSLGDATTSEFSRIRPNSDDDTGQHVERMSVRGPSDSLEADSDTGRGSGWADPWAERSYGARRESRQVANMLSGRSTHLLRRDQDGPFPHILSLAALALAVRLAGSNARPTYETQSIGPDSLNRNLQNLLQDLQYSAHLPADETITEDDGQGTGRPTAPAIPLSYLRVFRFVSTSTGSTTDEESSRAGQPSNSARTNDQRAARESGFEDQEGRTVALVVIGVQSIPSENPVREASSSSEPVVDSLLEVTSPTLASNLLSSESGILSRSANGRPRFPNSRRPSSGGTATFPAAYETQRHQRPSSSVTHSPDGTFIPESATSPSFPTSDSPPGPRPPPSTPAEPNYSYQVATPSRRPSSASVSQQAQILTREAAISHLGEAVNPITGHQDQPTLRAQHRRRSESEFARHRDLGAGAARRNGVVAPDDADNPAPADSRSRSWLIYVVGTNIAEDHLALTAPSLFTDNPSYEDMLLLSSLLGPARPPVASQGDVSTAGGLFRVCDDALPHAVECAQGKVALEISLDERCLVCLEEYQAYEELRQLKKCLHVFHRACIDEWLTTGRNSCPLCRGQGVPNEKHDGESQPAL